MKKKSAFTLIEVLVVTGIIALLISILMPSLKRVRVQARRASCASNLHEVGIAMMGYMHDSRDRMPYVSYMPSFDAAPLIQPCRSTNPPACDPVFFADVLKPQLMKNTQVLRCPDDVPGGGEYTSPRTGVNENKTYFETERSSYDYRWRLQGLTPQQFGDPMAGGAAPFWRRRTDAQKHLNPSSIWFSHDYDNFHGKDGTVGARRYVYIDGHVSDYEN